MCCNVKEASLKRLHTESNPMTFWKGRTVETELSGGQALGEGG